MIFENEPDLLTRRQAQSLLHIGKNKMLELIQNEDIPAIMIGNGYRIRKSDLIHYLISK